MADQNTRSDEAANAPPPTSLLGLREREQFSLAHADVVGVGTSSLAIRCQLGTETWVIKKFHVGASQVMLDQIAHEVEMLRISSVAPVSPNVVVLRDVFQADGPAICVSLEDCGDTLDSVLTGRANGDPAPLAAPYMADLCAGVAHLHRRRIVHRDIKPANLAIGTGERAQLKILDLGSACLLDDIEADVWHGCTCSGGTPLYMPLDALLGAPPKLSHDTWSVGVVGYLLFTGRLPFNAKDAAELRAVVRVGMHGPARHFESRPLPQEVTLALKELLSPHASPSAALRRAQAACASIEPPSPPLKSRSDDDSPVSVTELHPSAVGVDPWKAKLRGDLPQPPPHPPRRMHGLRRAKRVM